MSTYDAILRELSDIKRKIAELMLSPVPDWLPRTEVMRFLGYESTQMAAFEKNKTLVISKIGKRKFIKRDSLLKVLEMNVQQ